MSLQDLWQWPPSPPVVERWRQARARGAKRFVLRRAFLFAAPMFLLMMALHVPLWMNQKSPHPASYYISEIGLNLFIAVLFGVVIGGIGWMTLNQRLANLSSRRS